MFYLVSHTFTCLIDNVEWLQRMNTFYPPARSVFLHVLYHLLVYVARSCLNISKYQIHTTALETDIDMAMAQTATPKNGQKWTVHCVPPENSLI